MFVKENAIDLDFQILNQWRGDENRKEKLMQNWSWESRKIYAL